MITINTERGLIDVGDWRDVEHRPLFRANVALANEKLKLIIGWYLLKDEVLCGLAECRTPHRKGYIVTLESGLETNIGNVCGKKYFGVDFEEQSHEFDRMIEEAGYRTAVGHFMFGPMEALLAQVSEIRAGGALTLHRQLQAISVPGKGCPEPALRAIQDAAKQRDGVLHAVRQATTAELEQRRALAAPGQRADPYVREPVGRLDGIAALFPENDLRKLLVLNLEEPLLALQNLDVDQMSPADLKHWSKWTANAEGAVLAVRHLLDQARHLLTRANLGQVAMALEGEAEREAFARFIEKLVASAG